MSSIPTIVLNNGVRMPQLGFGVFQIPDAETTEAVAAADGGARSVTVNRDSLVGVAATYTTTRPGWLTDSASGTSWCWWDEVFSSAHKGVGSCDGTSGANGVFRGGLFVR